MNGKAMSNRHPVDELAEVRADIKVLKYREDELKEQVAGMMGDQDSVGGDEWIAEQALSERKGSIDEKAAKAAGVDLDRFRKPTTTIVTIRTVKRAREDA